MGNENVIDIYSEILFNCKNGKLLTRWLDLGTIASHEIVKTQKDLESKPSLRCRSQFLMLMCGYGMHMYRHEC